MAAYDSDYVTWIDKQIQLLQDKKFEELDLEHLIDEVESLGKSEKHAVSSLLMRIIEHRLKIRFEPHSDAVRGWQAEIANFQSQLQDILEDSPSLRRHAVEQIDRAYQRAVRAVAPYQYPCPATCPWTAEQIIGEEGDYKDK